MGRLLRDRLTSLPEKRIFGMRMRYPAGAFIVSLVVSAILLFRRPEGYIRSHTSQYFEYFWNHTITHPIDDLIRDAHLHHEKLLSEQSFDVYSAAARYRDRRGRHPPPGFDDWVHYATKHDAIIVESFFDRIYADIAPFWGLDARQTAERAASWEFVVRVRNGNATGKGDIEGHVPWLQLWTDLVAEAAPWLPDVDMPINMMDESRLIVPWETINGLVAEEQERRVMKSADLVLEEYSGLTKVDAKGQVEPYQPAWKHGNYWDYSRVACAPDSPSRDVPPVENLEEYPTFPEAYNPDYMHEGYVRNFTRAMDPCVQPHLRGMHGTFIEPITMSTSQELVPIFSGSKLALNNDILIPGAMYLTDNPFYSGGNTHGPRWGQKQDGVVWRGVASGGRNKAENWSHFQRHRLVEMLNGTTVSHMEEEEKDSRAPTFEMPSKKLYDFPRRREGTLGAWLDEFADAGFVSLLCFPADDCGYVSPHLSEVQSMPMKEQYRYKLMPDVDGNSFSARFRGFLLSTSLPLKATVYAEWHDDRLVPWLHFAPMDNTFQDLYGLLDYFARDDKGDRAAQFIADEGQAWAAKVLRREDMLLYVWRLLLEFARVCDEKRDYLGYIDDLRTTPLP